MKKYILFFLFYTGTVTLLPAQAQLYRNEYGYLMPSQTLRSEIMFNYPKPGGARTFFSFNGLQGFTKFYVELDNIGQLSKLPNADSLFAVVKTNLKLLADSLQNDGIVRRVDYFAFGVNPQIRIINHNQSTQNYVIAKGSLNQLKIEQDTLRIKGLTGDTVKKPYFLMFVVNNISDIYNLPDTSLNACINRLKAETKGANNDKGIYRANFNMQSSELINKNWKMRYKIRQELVPNFYAGMQYARGTFMPSFAYGLRYTFPNTQQEIKQLFLMNEMYFSFKNDINNKVHTDVNHFITLRYTQFNNNRKPGFEFISNVSLGYLVRQQGNVFEKNTFKLGLPGVRSGWLQIEPEFIFNGFFKNISPSIKLTLHYE